MKFFFISSDSIKALSAKKKLIDEYGQNNIEKADVIVPLGGDGFLLKSLHDFNKYNKPFYGINYGSIGFLMNSDYDEKLDNIISSALKIKIKPLNMEAKNNNGESFKSIAFNEISIRRQTQQTAKISIRINDIERMKELICDGVLVSTAAGSTAYNLSAHGSIIPLDSKLLALTPISSYRPRRWRGALLSEKTKINFHVRNSEIRSSSVAADHNEFNNVKEVEVTSSNDLTCTILFDNNHSIEEKVLKEQFLS
jgi:NAD+ kinase|tara:strand:- start:54 stop:812 length:759 start_codon:yes stop_codon:yes gene_type:complete